MSFFEEIKRRKVFQVAAVYAVVAWLLVQIITAVEAPLSLPDWTDTLVIVLVLAGFPLAVVLSWAYDITPTGIVRTRESSTGIDSGSLPGEPRANRASEAVREVLPNSVAVLPFENLSPNPDDAYFAAGIHEETLNYLTKIKDLSVIARTSVKRYAGTDKPISQIAAELGVGAVMEGSVRYAGERVRVTAQLIDAASDNHLWSEVYERDLADVFAIQADIASQIAAALEAELSTAEKQSIEALPTTGSSEAHALYLKAQALFGQGDTAIAVTTPPALRARIQSELDRAIALDAGFAYPYAMKSLLFAASRMYDPVSETDWPKFTADLDELVRSNAEVALNLSANLGLPYFALALNHQFNWRWAESRRDYQRAVELRPNDADLLTWYSTLDWITGHLDDAVTLARRGVELDPGNIYAFVVYAVTLHAAGRFEASVEAHESLGASHPDAALLYLHRALPEIALGHRARAIEALRLADRLMPAQAAPAIHLHLAYLYGRVGLHDDARRIVREVRSALGDRFVDPIVWVMAHLGAGERSAALESFKTAVERLDSRQEVFVRCFLKLNCWFDPILDESEFAALRGSLD